VRKRSHEPIRLPSDHEIDAARKAAKELPPAKTWRVYLTEDELLELYHTLPAGPILGKITRTLGQVRAAEQEAA
jgi:hypothetical protein